MLSATFDFMIIIIYYFWWDKILTDLSLFKAKELKKNKHQTEIGD